MRITREIGILMLAAVAFLYLLAPSIVPDFLPLLGWIDEGIATTIVLAALRHWGIDPTGLFGLEDKEGEQNQGDHTAQAQPEQIQQEGEMVQLNDRVRIPRRYIEQAIAQYERDQARSREYPY